MITFKSQIAWKSENKLENDIRNTEYCYPNPLKDIIYSLRDHPEITKHQSLSERYC